jgi:hypothetical protein
MQHWLGERLSAARERCGVLAESPVRLAFLVLVCAGILLRARGVWFGQVIPLWEDEAAWANRLIETPAGPQVLRAPGFMLASKLIVTWFSTSEAGLRFLPSVAGIAAVVLTPFVAIRLVRSPAAQLLFVAVVALHPGAIDLAKEFKPYSLALLCHLLLLWTALGYAREGRQRDLRLGVAVALLGPLFSHDVVFAYPAWFAVTMLRAFREKEQRHLMYLGASATACVAMLLLLRSSVSSGLGDVDTAVRYWGRKYDVFFVGDGAQGKSRVGWTMARVFDLTGMSGMRREVWQSGLVSPASLGSLRVLDFSLWGLLSVGGVGALLYRRRLLDAGLLLSPLLTLIVFNRLGYWPLGLFRTNLFALVYVAGLASFALDWPIDWRWGLAFVPVGVLVLLPFVLVGRTSHARKASSFVAHAAFTDAMDELLRLQGPHSGAGELLALDDKSCAPWRYYTSHHPDTTRAAELKQRFDARCSKSLKLMAQQARKATKKQGHRAFMLASGEEQILGFDAAMPRDLRVVGSKLIGEADALVARLERQPRR